MGLFDEDHGPFTNMMLNQAFFKFPSTRPPGEIAEVLGPAYAVAGVGLLAGLAIFGGVKGCQSLTGNSQHDSTGQVSSELETSQHLVEEGKLIPKEDTVEQFRSLLSAYGQLSQVESWDGWAPPAAQAPAPDSPPDLALSALTERGKVKANSADVIILNSAFSKLPELLSRGSLSSAEKAEVSMAKSALSDILVQLAEAQR